MIKQGMKTEVATLSVSCRQGRYINLVFDMKHASDVRFVDGELRISSSLASVAVFVAFTWGIIPRIATG